MWYFAWIPGFGCACVFAILNGMRHEMDPVGDPKNIEESRSL